MMVWLRPGRRNRGLADAGAGKLVDRDEVEREFTR
jgi:predicted transcriptional regulator